MSLSAKMNFIPYSLKHNQFLKRFSSEVQKTEKPTQPQQALGSPTSETPKNMMKVSLIKKRMFVMAGLYKSVAECPDAMSLSTMARNMDRFRVRASLVIMALSGLGALSSILLAKGVVEDFEEEKRRK